MFLHKSIHIEAGNGGFVKPNDIEPMFENNKPLITNWDFITPYKSSHIISDNGFLQDLIIKQDESITKLSHQVKQLQNELEIYKNVSNT